MHTKIKIILNVSEKVNKNDSYSTTDCNLKKITCFVLASILNVCLVFNKCM